MYLLIEHDGTEVNNNLAVALKHIAEDDFGATCEFIISDVPDIGIYNEDQKELIRFNGPRADVDLNYILKFINEEEEDDEIRNIRALELRKRARDTERI